MHSSELLFWRHPAEDSEVVYRKIAHKAKGAHFYFRRIKSLIQARLFYLFDHDAIPRVKVHGSAHVDNYSKTNFGEGLVDFDRSCFGPYLWDVFCFLLSVSLRKSKNFEDVLFFDIFYQEYLDGLFAEDYTPSPFSYFQDKKEKGWENDVELYLKKSKKWGGLLNSHSINPADIFVQELFRQYMVSQEKQAALDNYKIKQASFAMGTFNRERFLILVEEKTRVRRKVLFDIKKAKGYAEPHLPHFPYYDYVCEHHGKRLCEAAEYYAPYCMQNEGYATVNGIAFWGREVPLLNKKIKDNLNKNLACEFSKSIAAYLANAHARSINDVESIHRHLLENYENLWLALQEVKFEVLEARERYLAG